MTYHYKTRIRLTLDTGDRASHMYDKAYAQQQKRRVTQTLHRTTVPLNLGMTNFGKFALIPRSFGLCILSLLLSFVVFCLCLLFLVPAFYASGISFL